MICICIIYACIIHNEYNHVCRYVESIHTYTNISMCVNDRFKVLQRSVLNEDWFTNCRIEFIYRERKRERERYLYLFKCDRADGKE